MWAFSGRPSKEQIAQEVQGLMTHEFVGVTENFFLVMNTVHPHDNGVVQRSAPGQPLAFERSPLRNRNKTSGPGISVRKLPGVNVNSFFDRR
jgi:hypothetical protein